MCVKYSTIPDFYSARVEIAADMSASASSVLSGFYASLVNFQLLNVQLQPATESKIIDTLVAEQAQITESIIQQSTVIRAGLASFKNEADAKVRVINSEALSKGISITSGAEAEGFVAVTAAQSAKLTQIKEGLGLTGAEKEKLMAYVWVAGTETNKHKTEVVVGTDSAILGRASTGD